CSSPAESCMRSSDIHYVIVELESSIIRELEQYVLQNSNALIQLAVLLAELDWCALSERVGAPLKHCLQRPQPCDGRALVQVESPGAYQRAGAAHCGRPPPAAGALRVSMYCVMTAACY